MRITRRAFGRWAAGATAGMATTGLSFAASGDEDGPILREGGQYTQPWFLNSFLELADDLAEAASGGKRLALMWEQEGCPYCRETHLVNLTIPEVRDYVRDNFEIVQLDIRGSREVVDFDGTPMPEGQLARINGVRFTPTIQFFPETIEEFEGRPGKAAEVARMPGYFRPFHFLVMFQYVRGKGYLEGNFRTFLKARMAAYRAEGKPIPSW